MCCVFSLGGLKEGEGAAGGGGSAPVKSTVATHGSKTTVLAEGGADNDQGESSESAVVSLPAAAQQLQPQDAAAKVEVVSGNEEVKVNNKSVAANKKVSLSAREASKKEEEKKEKEKEEEEAPEQEEIGPRRPRSESTVRIEFLTNLLSEAAKKAAEELDNEVEDVKVEGKTNSPVEEQKITRGKPTFPFASFFPVC